MKSLDEILSLRRRSYIFTEHFDEWCERRSKAQNIIEMIAQLNDLCGEKYNRKIWADECVRHSLFKEYAAHLSFADVDELDRVFNNLMGMLDILTLAREIDDFVEWQQWHDEQADSVTNKYKDLSVLVNTGMNLMVEGEQLGNEMFEKFSAKESPLFQELNQHTIHLNKELFAKRGTKTKTGWLQKALNRLIPSEYPCKGAFIAKLLRELGNTEMTRQNSTSMSKGGYT